MKLYRIEVQPANGVKAWYGRHAGEQFYAYLAIRERENSQQPVFRICEFTEGVVRNMINTFYLPPVYAVVLEEILVNVPTDYSITKKR